MIITSSSRAVKHLVKATQIVRAHRRAKAPAPWADVRYSPAQPAGERSAPAALSELVGAEGPWGGLPALTGEMSREGFLPAGGCEIDREIAEARPCWECGAGGQVYAAFYRPSGDGRGRYRAFSVCPVCGDWGEF